MKKWILQIVRAGLFLYLSGFGSANATMIFSDVSITSHSVTFNIDGDMSGYSAIGSNAQFSIQYKGDLWAGLTTPAINTWSTSVFDTHDFDNQGNTGIWASEWGYTWSRFDASLATAIAINRTVTVDFTEDLLNPYALAGELVFVIGTGNSLYPSLTTVLDSVSFDGGIVGVAEPNTKILFALGLVGIILIRNRKGRILTSLEGDS